jgi:hypothetical protein
MSVPLMLGGVEIPLHAGAPVITDGKLGAGDGSFRLSGGTLVSMERWSKRAGTISAQGWMPPGIGGLDFSQPLELRSTKVRTVGGTGLVYTLPFTPRPDVAPWAFALVDGDWKETPCSTVDGVTTVTAVAGAEGYQVWAMPIYSVKATPPDESQDQGTGSHSWALSWEEA